MSLSQFGVILKSIDLDTDFSAVLDLLDHCRLRMQYLQTERDLHPEVILDNLRRTEYQLDAVIRSLCAQQSCGGLSDVDSPI